jgi:hypothetical protein
LLLLVLLALLREVLLFESGNPSGGEPGSGSLPSSLPPTPSRKIFLRLPRFFVLIRCGLVLFFLMVIAVQHRNLLISSKGSGLERGARSSLYIFWVREDGFGSGTRQPTLLLMTIASYSEHARLLVPRAEG